VPFVALISAILLLGVLGLLFFNTSMQQASFRETKLNEQARDLNAQVEAARLTVNQLRDPQRIARLAQHMGMVIPAGASGVVDIATGKITGDPVPAIGHGLPLDPDPAVRPNWAPKPVRVTVSPSATATTTKATKTGTQATTKTGTQPTTKTGTKTGTQTGTTSARNGAAGAHGASPKVD
jgi:type II secretory pathway pseudopilin PulG